MEMGRYILKKGKKNHKNETIWFPVTLAIFSISWFLWIKPGKMNGQNLHTAHKKTKYVYDLVESEIEREQWKKRANKSKFATISRVCVCVYDVYVHGCVCYVPCYKTKFIWNNPTFMYAGEIRSL